MDRNDIIKALLGWGVKILIGLIPAVAGLFAIPVVGWIAGFVVSWLTGLLYDWVERLARYKGIEEQVRKDLVSAKGAFDALKAEIQAPTGEVGYEEKRLAFDAAVRALGRVRVLE